MGDGGFWHNGLTSGVGNAVFNQSDNLLLLVDNGYSAATGGQDVLSSKAINPIRSTNNPIETAVRGVGVQWVRSVNHTYSLQQMKAALREATGADYALFTYIRDSYASSGRKAMRVLGFLAGAAMGGYVDIGGGQQVGVATLVDLRTGQVVWFNLMSNQSGDLRDAEGAKETVVDMLTGLPL